MWRTNGLVSKNLRISLVGEGSKKNLSTQYINPNSYEIRKRIFWLKLNGSVWYNQENEVQNTKLSLIVFSPGKDHPHNCSYRAYLMNVQQNLDYYYFSGANLMVVMLQWRGFYQTVSVLLTERCDALADCDFDFFFLCASLLVINFSVFLFYL